MASRKNFLRNFWNLLASVWRLRKRGDFRCVSSTRDWFCRRRIRLRFDGPHWGLRLRADFRGHFNPAVSLGLAAAGRFSFKELGPYVIVQVLGATAAAGVLYLIAVGNVDFSLAGGFAANGYDEHSPAGYTLRSGFIIEIVLTGFFLLVILGSTESRVPAGFAPIAIGLALTLIHLISIPVTNTSVNPARSTGQALFVGGWALEQLWVFWVAPLVGGLIGGILHRLALAEK